MKLVLLILALGTCGACAGEFEPTPSGSDPEPVHETSPSEQEPDFNDLSGETQDTSESNQDDDAMALYRRAQEEMKEGKLKEGYASAKEAMKRFIAEDNDLAWMLLESITTEEYRIDVHFNMGPDERNPKENGIVRPLSFRIWSIEDEEQLLQTVDFELGYAGGEPRTAAIGETTEFGHANYGILPVDSSYESIRNAVLELVANR